MLTSSKDWNVIMWDMASDIDPPQRKTTIRFDASVSSASFHPRNRLALYCMLHARTHLLSAKLFWLCFNPVMLIWSISGKNTGGVSSLRRCKMTVTRNQVLRQGMLLHYYRFPHIPSMWQVSHDSGSIRSYWPSYLCRNLYRIYSRL